MAERKAKTKTKTKKSVKSKGPIETSNLPAKYRPRNIDDYVGQDSLVRTVKGWQKSRRFPQTILLVGTTGSGKTTLARILALMVNCETANICGECPSCKQAKAANYQHPDITEYNMGTQGKIEDVRSMITVAQQLPMFNKRVAIIDEAHLSSKAAESALLVPTEEPPAHMLWIFCTTESHKIIDTMKNRCTTLTIKPIEEEVMVKRLREIAKAERVPAKDKAAVAALKMIASTSEGQMRKGISLLDSLLGQVIAGSKFNRDTVLQETAAGDEIHIDEKAVQMTLAILDEDLPAAVGFCREAEEPRQLVFKVRWLVSWLIGEQTKTNKFTPPIARMFTKAKAKIKLKYTLHQLLMIQRMLVDSEIEFNSVNISEQLLLETGIANLIIHKHFSTK